MSDLQKWKNPLTVILAAALILLSISLIYTTRHHSSDPFLSMKDVKTAEEMAIKPKSNFVTDSIGRKVTIKNNSTQLCIIARTYEKQFTYLVPFLLSLHNPKAKPFVFITLTDKSDTAKAEKIAKFVNDFTYEYTFVIPQKFENSGDFGYKMTDYAMEYLLDNPKYNCEYFMFTNGDNLYGQKMIDEFVLPLMHEGVDIFGFDFISHYKQQVIFVDADCQST